MGSSSYSIRNFDPLLRDLLAWGLVKRSEDSWELVEAAQSRLDEVAHIARPVSVESFVYLDHRCAQCQERTPTRLRDGQYVCDVCFQRQQLPTEAEPQPASETRRWHLRRERTRDVDPLAG
jgi:hypothetical protein